MSFLTKLTPNQFKLDPQEFANFLHEEISVTANWTNNKLINELTSLGKELFGNQFSLQRSSILNDRNAYTAEHTSPSHNFLNYAFNNMPITKNIKLAATENNLWVSKEEEINQIVYNINQFKFHLQGNLDMHFINAIHFHEQKLKMETFRLKKYEASNLIGTFSDFVNFYRTGVLDFSSNKEHKQFKEDVLKNMSSSYFTKIESLDFFLLAIVTHEDYARFPFLREYEGLDYFHPFRINRPLASYFTVTEKIVPLYGEFLDEISFAAYLKADDILENYLRDLLKLPAKNESWISEIMLLRKLEARYPNLNIIHQAKFPWLGRQSIDVYILEKKIAIEYQGEQHYKAVSLFGGENGLQITMARDKKKIELCLKNGISILHVLPNYNPLEIFDFIEKSQAHTIKHHTIGSL